MYEYIAAKARQPAEVDAVWDKPQWVGAGSVTIDNFMGEIPRFRPQTEVRIMHEPQHIYIIFKVDDRCVLSRNKKINDPVWEDSCVEFFFAPDTNYPERYFNLEVNCGGIPLMHYNIKPRKEFIKLDPDDIARIKIAHSLPALNVPEIKEPVKWTVECRIPLDMLEKYAKIDYPGKGVAWRANLYKIAVNNSNPHYATWAPVINDVPDFHLPRFFGKLRFDRDHYL